MDLVERAAGKGSIWEKECLKMSVLYGLVCKHFYYPEETKVRRERESIEL